MDPVPQSAGNDDPKHFYQCKHKGHHYKEYMLNLKSYYIFTSNYIQIIHQYVVDFIKAPQIIYTLNLKPLLSTKRNFNLSWSNDIFLLFI